MNELNWTKGFFNKPSESMNNELLKQAKDEVAKKYGNRQNIRYSSWEQMEYWLSDNTLNTNTLLERFDEVCELYSSRQSQQLQERVEIWIDTAKKQGERIYELEERLRLIKGECNRPDDEPCNITYIEMQADKALSGEATKEKEEKYLVAAEGRKLIEQLSESLEAYNRECKRVDELTEVIAVLQSRLKSEYERGYNQGMVEAAKETD